MGKGEVARREQFLLFPQCFQKKLVLQTRKNLGLFGKGLKEMYTKYSTDKEKYELDNKLLCAITHIGRLIKVRYRRQTTQTLPRGVFAKTIAHDCECILILKLINSSPSFIALLGL